MDKEPIDRYPLGTTAPAVKVLLVEDESSFAQLAQAMLRGRKETAFQVEWANNLTAGLEMQARSPGDVVLLDLYLPDSAGLETLRTMHQHHPNVPIVVMTGMDDDELARNALMEGARDFFIKTELNPTLLARVILYAIDRNALACQLESQARQLEVRVRQRTSELQAAQDQWEDTFNAVPDLITIIDKDYSILRANQAAARALGTTSDKLVGCKCFEVMHDSNGPTAGCPHALLLKDGNEHVHELHHDPTGRDYLVSTSPLHDRQGQVTGSVHVARDITQLREAQKSLTESERQHRMFLNRLPDPIVVYDNQGKVLYANAAFEQAFGWSLQELKDRKVAFVPEDAMAETQVGIGLMMKGQPVVDFETTRLTKSGDRRTVLLNTAPLFSGQNQQMGNIVILRDITAIRKAERARRVSEQKYRELVETMNEGMTVADTDGRIVFCNARICRMLGYPEGGLVGLRVSELLDAKSVQAFARQWEKRLAGVEETYEAVFKQRDGGAIHVTVSPRIIRDDQGRMAGSLAVITDITERKKLEGRLLQSQKLESIGELAAGIAHEINTPTQYVSSNTIYLEEAFGEMSRLLTAYMEFADRLEEQGLEREGVARLRELAQELDYEFLSEEVPQAIAASKDGLARIARIVLSIKEFAHPGQREKRPTDINRAIQNTITVARNEWKYVAEVEADLDPELPPVPCVLGEVNQVMLNLIVNAAHAIADAAKQGGDVLGRITIRTRQADGFAEISVADTGPGVPEELRTRIFDPFFTTKEPGKGTGQGLAIAYRVIVEDHNGKLLVDDAEGGGARFTLCLPLVDQPDD